MIMELPPYHKPKWALLFKTTMLRAKDIFLRAFRGLSDIKKTPLQIVKLHSRARLHLPVIRKSGLIP
ncbi:MAG: hypothetical protein LBD47_10710 [Treponema sp.]|nr:hypothetical protein [Treponema sp.]